MYVCYFCRYYWDMPRVLHSVLDFVGVNAREGSNLFCMALVNVKIKSKLHCSSASGLYIAYTVTDKTKMTCEPSRSQKLES